jgi:hypothetical protein
MTMIGHPDEGNGDPVVTAIERVLKIELDGIEMLRKSRVDAEHLLTEARARAAATANRADRCISKLHAAYLQKVDRDIEALAQAHAATNVADKTYDAEVLSAAVRRLAAKLTGGT